MRAIKDKIRVVVTGASGRMGQEVLSEIEKSGSFKVAGTVDPHGKTSAAQIEDIDPSRCDGVVDFSAPRATLQAAKWCGQHKKFLVSGTTGLTKSQQKALVQIGRKTAILWAPNLSLGVASLKSALSSLRGLQDFDFQIEEIHHRHKVDQPSGTALDLQLELSRVVRKKVPPPLSVRGGGVRGVHRIWALGEGEILSFEHVALDRGIFARGALASASWLFQKRKPGFFCLEDLWDSQKN